MPRLMRQIEAERVITRHRTSTVGSANRRSWWRDGVIYQCYPRSFADGNGDGVGDLRGVMSRLRYLSWLGVDAVWLNPTFPSPNADWGYDVADYVDVDPELGTLADMDALVTRARAHGIAILLDLVPNHTSARHPWFQAALRGPDDPHRDYYVWAQPAPDGGPPNNWVSMFGGPAWTFDASSHQYYLHNFLPSQPDLNWWNPRVRDAFDEIMRFWLDRGVAGFRIDVAHGIVKDRELRDNPPACDTDRASWRLRGQAPVYSMNRPEVHDLHKHWRRLVDGHSPPGTLLGETLVHELEQLAAFYGTGDDELHLAFNFPFVLADADAEALKSVVRRTEELLPPDAWPSWILSNHDLVRFPTRWAGGDRERARCLLLLLLTLRGTPVLYYGDELGLPQADVAPERRRDPRPACRDGARTPMPWHGGADAGFSWPGVEPWLPIAQAPGLDVETQMRDRSSMLHLTRDLIALRRANTDLARGDYVELPSPAGIWMFRRGRSLTVALNLTGEPATVPVRPGRIAIGTRRGCDDDRIHERLDLPSHTAFVIEHDDRGGR